MTAQIMDLLHNLGQLMVFGFYGKQMTPEIKKFIDEDRLGNIILFSRNLDHPDQIRNLTHELQNEAKKAGHKHPLLICTDQENGAVRRLGEGATEFPGSMLIGATHSVKNAYEIAKRTADELKSVGINWNLAPVVDVNNNSQNPVICTRSFGEDPAEVAEMGQAFMQGMQEEGIIPTLKHFPGHGDTGIDSHLDLPVIPHGLPRLEEVELVPFKQCIEAGADVIMSAHIYFPAIEKQYGLPATLSKKVLTGLLREKLHYQGVITTDCLEMRAIDDRFGTAHGAVMAFQAGTDLVMVSHTFAKQRRTFEAVGRAVKAGNINAQSIRMSMERMDRLKGKYLDWDSALEQEIISVETGEEHRLAAERIYREGITLVKNGGHVLPLSCSANSRVLFIYSKKVAFSQAEDHENQLPLLKSIVESVHPSADVVMIEDPSIDSFLKKAISGQENYQAIVVLTVSVTKGSKLIEVIERLKQNCDTPIVIIAGKSPYDARLLPETDGYVCTYDFNLTSLNIVIRSLFGLEEVNGTLPVSL